MFASAAGGDALKQDDTGHGAWGCRVGSPRHAHPVGEATLLQAAARVVHMEGVAGERHFHANVARLGQQSAIRKRGASRVDR
jgi:hypothetical protein